MSIPSLVELLSRSTLLGNSGALCHFELKQMVPADYFELSVEAREEEPGKRTSLPPRHFLIVSADGKYTRK